LKSLKPNVQSVHRAFRHQLRRSHDVSGQDTLEHLAMHIRQPPIQPVVPPSESFLLKTPKNQSSSIKITDK
jgi:hypothetical protein